LTAAETFCRPRSLLNEGELHMDHAVVVRDKITERYLLDELEPGQREEFEEHYFDCRECARDVRAASLFVEETKAVLAEEPERVVVPVRPGRPAGWFAWLRPTIAAPALAILLAVIAYQGLFTHPASRPQVLAWATLNVSTRGASTQTIAVPHGGDFGLIVNIPPDSRFSGYIADLHNPAGKIEWSLSISTVATQDQYLVQVPGANREAGIYTLAVRGITAAGESQEVGRESFELQIQK
jgi:anti-sigma factor RsiW